MKLFTTLFLFFSLATTAQVSLVFKPGATWYYSVSYGSYGGYEKLTYTGDTLIDGRKVAIMNIDAHEVGLLSPDIYYHKDTIYPPRYFYADSIWMYQVVDGIFSPIYKHFPEIGDSWSVTGWDTCCNCQSNLVYVTQKGTTRINETDYPWFEVRSDTTSVIDVASKVFIGIGPKRFPFMYQTKACNGAVVDNGVYDIMCYQDDNMFVKFIPEDCDHIRYLTVNDLLYFTTRIFPNPAREVIHVDSEAALWRVSVYDYMGRLMYEEYANARKRVDVPTVGISKGMYIVKVETTAGMISQQVVIE